MKVIIKSIVWKSKDIFSLDLFLSNPLNALPGQFVLVSLPDCDKRAYSIVNESKDSITLGIKVQSGTSKVLSKMSIGSSFDIFGPFGVFTPRVGKHVVLVGGGIGVTPLISLYNYYRKKGIPTDVLISSRTDFVFNECFDSPTLFNTKEGRRISANDIAKDSLVYICGPKGMIISLRNNLIKEGYNENNIFSEDFS